MKIYYILIILFLAVTQSYAQKGKIEGRVFDANTNEPLPFSNVIIKGTVIGTSSDFDGKFIITQVDPGFYILEASSLGHEKTLSPEIQVIPGKSASIDIPLKKSTVVLAEVNVTTAKFVKNEESPVSLRTITISEIENSAGTNRDISKVIQSFPGVAAFPAANRNDVIVRGGGSNESRFFLDGIEIPNINHFATQGASGGTNGILNADFLREVNFYSSAFPASRGNALSSVFDFKQIDGNPDKMKYRATLGASETGLTMDGPLGEKSSMILSVRRSYLQFLFKALGLPFLPTYNDYQFKTRYRINEKNDIKIISIGAYDINKLDTKISNPTEFQQYLLNYLPSIEQWNYVFGGVHTHYRSNGYSSFVLSRNMLTNSSSKYLNNDDKNPAALVLDYTSSEVENKFRYETIIQTDKPWKIEFGIDGAQAKYTNNTFQQIFLQDTVIPVKFDSKLTFYRYGAFGQYSHRFLGSRLSLSFGARIDGNTYNDEMSNPLSQFSPRFSASFTLTEKMSLNASVGRFFQLPGYTSLGYRDNLGNLVNKDNGIRYMEANHLVGGLEYQPNGNIRITAEGFYKAYQHNLFSINDSISLAHRPIDFGSVGSEPVSSTSSGLAYGAELLAQYKVSSKSSIVLSYTYTISEYEDKNGDLVPSSWDNRHIFIISGNYRFKKNWSAAAKWRYAGGLPYTPYDIETSSSISAWDVQGRPYSDYNQLNAERFKPFHQLDIRIDKSYYFKKASLRVYVDIQNLYNFKSQDQGRITNLNESGVPVIDPTDPTKYSLRTIPSAGSGTVLPTIGVILDF